MRYNSPQKCATLKAKLGEHFNTFSRFIFSQPLKQWQTGKKREKDGNMKIWISRERKELFRWNKNIFTVFEGLSLDKKIKNWKKIADTSFKASGF